jgi:FKBP-type peptidyl-prolyl cis-trans isomerase FklB
MRMKQIVLFVGVLGLILSSCSNKPNYNVKIKTETDSISYYIGLYYGKTLKAGGELESLNVDAVAKGLNEAFMADSLKISDQALEMQLQSHFMKLQKRMSDNNLKAGREFLENNKKKAGIQTLPSGLQYEVIKEGTGPVPDSSNVVSFFYTGYHINGKFFESNVKKEPLKYKVNQLIPGWTQALLKMHVGSKWKLYIPSELAYGERVGRGSPIKPNETLIFDVELVNIEKEQPQPAQPAVPQSMMPKAKKK